MTVVVQYVNALFVVFTFIVLLRVLSSWIPRPPIDGIGRAIFDFLHQSTDWFLRPFRRVIPMVGMFDLSPIVALIALMILNNVVVRILASLT